MAEAPLAGQVALVTGASQGIGAATARALAAKGAHVVLVARKSAGLESVEDAIHDAGGTATIAPLDLTEPESIGRLSAAIAERWDRLDILVICAAALPMPGPVTQIDQKGFNQAITLNLLATQALLAAFDPLLKRAPAGKVIGLTSSVAAEPRAYWSAYASTKAAFDNLLTTYGLEVAQLSEICVAVLDPGATRTAMRAKAFPGENPESVKSPEVVGDHIAQLAQDGFVSGFRARTSS